MTMAVKRATAYHQQHQQQQRQQQQQQQQLSYLMV